jgi:hypothetical protein
MSSAIRKDDSEEPPEPKYTRLLQVIGALIATGFALWFLFGIPVYVLFGSFFES